MIPKTGELIFISFGDTVKSVVNFSSFPFSSSLRANLNCSQAKYMPTTTSKITKKKMIIEEVSCQVKTCALCLYP